jgi:hypothetical protein
MAEPPLDVGADHETATERSWRTTVTEVGAPGAVDGVMDGEALEALEVPTALVAVTVKV